MTSQKIPQDNKTGDSCFGSNGGLMMILLPKQLSPVLLYCGIFCEVIVSLIMERWYIIGLLNPSPLFPLVPQLRRPEVYLDARISTHFC